MTTDGSKIHQPLSPQVCIIGSGAAGVTLAWYLQKAGIDVVLAEAGRQGEPYNYSDKDVFYSGETTGRFSTLGVYAPSTVDKSNPNSFLTRPSYAGQSSPNERERTYGGTTAHFGGQSRPLDPIVFKEVAGYPAWPVSYGELKLWFDQAAAFCRLHTSFEAEYWAKKVNGAVPQLENFNAEMYQFIGLNEDRSRGGKNFALRKFDGKTIAESNAHVIQNANLTGIEITGDKVTKLHFASLSGGGTTGEKLTVCNKFTVEPDICVLATGAVENARQMLLAGIDNKNIGKYFMCHPLVAGYIDGRGDPINIVYEGGNDSYLTPEEKGLMDGNIVRDGVETGKWTDENGVTIEGRFIPNESITRAEGIGRCWFWAGGGASYFEQAPNANSRVSLSDETDPVFNQRLTKIDWQFCDADRKTYETTVDLFNKAVQKINKEARVEAAPWEEIVERAVVNGHHLGTTRMSETAEDGVVDKNLKSHDVDNLYVAGSSVWRTAGISNPTFSIFAFSIRLADHLKKILNS